MFPYLVREVHRWRYLADRIPDPVLRQMALDAQRDKRGNLEGAVAFATFVPRSHRAAAVRVLTAYQAIFDYLDTLAEQPNSDPIANGRQLNQALLTAIEPRASHSDYYSLHSHSNDNGYLKALIDTCRVALSGLPSYTTIANPARRAAVRIAAYQTLNHGDVQGSRAAFADWADQQTQPGSELSWWETGAAAGSSLGIFALAAAAARPDLGQEEAAAIENAYFPWIGALNSLLDSLIDQQEDAAAGQPSLIDYYESPEETATRLQVIAAQALTRTRALQHGSHHTMILAAMASFYLSAPQALSPGARPATTRVLETMGDLAAPTMLVLGARRTASRISKLRNRSE
ncbi:MAG TPA: DUF2600 family protein [Solirubrobacteraceae bacterium]|nr:DUF2600 family protein [Solirubrobacteraceae bacterium]